tara:strand:- start:311 stop:535 length:225 start_codon:yes stop_codon:yes gene_type:complete
MTERLDALVVKEKDGKAFFTKIGAAFPNKSGDGFTLVLDALPTTNSEGETRILLRKPLPPRQEGNGGNGGSGGW